MSLRYTFKGKRAQPLKWYHHKITLHSDVSWVWKLQITREWPSLTLFQLKLATANNFASGVSPSRVKSIKFWEMSGSLLNPKLHQLNPIKDIAMHSPYTWRNEHRVFKLAGPLHVLAMLACNDLFRSVKNYFVSEPDANVQYKPTHNSKHLIWC